MKIEIINKRGQQGVGSLLPAILTIVVVVIALVLGLVFVQTTRNIDIIDKANSQEFINETVTTVTGAGDNLVCNSNPASQCSIVYAYNATNNNATNQIDSNNYTVSGCNFRGTSETIWNNTNWNVTYSCTFGGVAYVSSNDSLVALGDFADFIPLFVIAISVALVIGLVLAAVAFKRQR